VAVLLCAAMLAPAAARERSVTLSRGEARGVAAASAADKRSKTPAAASPSEAGPLMAIVSIASQSIEVHGPGGLLQRSRVSTGQPGHATPTGVFSILQRRHYHESNIYSGALMPYMQRLTWSGIALHEGRLPGYPASHGCIRLPSAFAQTLWGLGRIGMRVIVSPTDVRPEPFSHEALPQPVAVAHGPAPVRVAAAGESAAEAMRRIAPRAAAEARLAEAIARKTEAERAVRPAQERALARSAEARRLSEALRAASEALAEAEEELALVRMSMVTVQTEEGEAKVRERIVHAEARAVAARTAHSELQASERTVSDDSFALAAVAREAVETAAAAAEELGLARRGVEPISVFVSRRTGRVHVRQGFGPLLEAPVTIEEPARPLGTHVFTAMSDAAVGTVQWSVVTVPTVGGETPRRGSDAGGERIVPSAAEALGRIRLPEEARQLIAERLWPGASLIVSDYGLGETGEHTDFVIVTR
jgi:hypothetical protein